MAISMGVRPDVDKIGAVASGLCAVHCALIGLAFAVLPALRLEILADPRIDLGFLATALGLGAWAVRSGFKKHGNWAPFRIFLLGFVAILVSHGCIGHAHPGDDHLHNFLNLNVGIEWDWLGTLLSVFGGLSLVTFHLLNHRLGAKAGCHCRVCEPHKSVEGLPHTR